VTGCETVAEPSLGSALAVAEARAGAAGVVVTGSLYTAGATKVLMG
jgi:folylpolyglutamate synthase/dihydropteroate synthase